MPPTQRAWLLFLVLAHSPSAALKGGDVAGWGLREDGGERTPADLIRRRTTSNTIDVARVTVDQNGRVFADTGEQWKSLADCIEQATKGRHLTANADLLPRFHG